MICACVNGRLLHAPAQLRLMGALRLFCGLAALWAALDPPDAVFKLIMGCTTQIQ
jgi:hypothetical protein